jgi:cytochrome c oxidase assembly factor CtaG
MIKSMFRGAGQVALWAATMAFLAGVSLLLVGSFLLTWPILRKSPRDRRIKATMDFAAAGLTLMTVFSDSKIKKLAEELASSENDA